MKSAQAKRSSSIFTPRPKSASRNTSAHTSRAASPVARSPRSPAPAQTISWQPNPPCVTTWTPGDGTHMIIVETAEARSVLAKGTGDELIKDRYAAVVAIPYGQTITFQGIADVCVLRGSITVCEHVVVPGGGWTRAYSPSSHPLLAIHSIEPDNSPAALVLGAVDSDIKQIADIWEKSTNGLSAKDSAVVVVRSVHCGLECIGMAAPPFRNLFKLKPYDDRRLDSGPKRVPKRKLAPAAGSAAVSKLKRSVSDASMAQSETAAVDTGGYDSDESTVEDLPIDTDNSAKIEEGLGSAIGLPNFYPVSFLTPDLQLLQTPRDWQETLELVSTAVPQLDKEFNPISPVLVVAGGQNQGKSTFSRMLINRLLSRYGKLFYLETDLGQSELAPPGALTLTMISAPLLGPPFTHASQVEPYHAVYMGDTTPRNNPDQYVLAIQELITIYRCYISQLVEKRNGMQLAGGSDVGELDELTIPLVVNTDGWLTGLGIDLHYSICEAARPTSYIQIYNQFDNESRGADGSIVEAEPLVDFGSIEGCAPQQLWITAMNHERAVHTLYTKSSKGGNGSEFVPSSSDTVGSEMVTRKGPRHTGYDMRTLAFISHLYMTGGSVDFQLRNQGPAQLAGPTWNMAIPLATQRPLVVPWSDLLIWFGDEDIPPSQALRALNGTLVGVIAVANVPRPDGRVWTANSVKALYNGDKGINGQAAIDLSESSARILHRASIEGLQAEAIAESYQSYPQIVYGRPNTQTTTFIAHGVVRSIDPSEGALHLLLPPLVTQQNTHAILSRIVGIYKGTGPGMGGVDIPIWPMIDGGYAERAMGASSRRGAVGGRSGRFKTGSNDDDIASPIGIQEAPYLSIEVDEGI
ncbi:Polynucleotide 5'-hydroxyl-kinase grc3, partial [Linderina pennispora]